MIRNSFFYTLLLVTVFFTACKDDKQFADTQFAEIPVAEEMNSDYLWIGPDYKLSIYAKVEDVNGIKSIRVVNSEWGIDKLYELTNKPEQYTLIDTLVVKKDANKVQHEVDLSVTNNTDGLLKTKISVRDLSQTNQIAGYSPDLVPPSIQVTSPTTNRFYGFESTPVQINLKALIRDNEELASIYVKVWGETAAGASITVEDNVVPAAGQEMQYNYDHLFELPGGEVGEYQFLIKSIDASGNEGAYGGTLIVGLMDRLYLSDAKNAFEVTNQGYDAYAAASAWGLGTLVAMTKVATNKFTLNYYHRNDADDNIRFIAFMGNDKPFGTSSRTINYTLTGPNVLGHASGTANKITSNQAAADFKLPVTKQGYYTITVDITAKTITAVEYSPVNPSFANTALFPNYSPSSPWEYMPIICGGGVVGTAGWAETTNNTSLWKESGRDYIYSGEFTTLGGVNIGFMAPKAALITGQNVGWFRLPAARANMKDNYGDLVSAIWPIGASGNGANYGISLPGSRKYYANYDLITYRLRIVQVP